MKKVYLDTCCYNRIFDDRHYETIYFERNTILLIFEQIIKGKLLLIGSEILLKEVNDIPNKRQRDVLRLLCGLCSDIITPDKEIIRRAKFICQNTNIKVKDSIHLACAEAAKADVLLTVDKKFMNNANRLPADIILSNPDEWMKEVRLWQM